MEMTLSQVRNKKNIFSPDPNELAIWYALLKEHVRLWDHVTMYSQSKTSACRVLS